MTDYFVCITTLSTSTILLRLVYFCFHVVLMALFCAAIRRDSVSLLRFPFHSHVKFSHVRLCLFVDWNIHRVVFLPIFIFKLMLVLSVLFLVAVISLLQHFLYVVYESAFRCINAIFNAGNPLPPLFLDTTSSLGWKTWCIVMNFLILCFICWSSALVHFKNGPEYLTGRDSPGVYPFDEISAI